jgi:enoyl-CoA hydratase/carnithine racemase
MTTDAILLERRDEIAILTLNRPERRNAIGLEVLQELIARMESCEADAGCRAVVLTGSGSAFSSGGDISEMKPRSPLARRETLYRFRSLVRLVNRGSKVYVAAVNGPAFGAGFSIAMLCDWVVVDEKAVFSAAFTKIGLMPDVALMWSLPNRVGATRAKQLMLSAESVNAERARLLGIADETAGQDGVVSCAVAAARRMCQGAPLSVALIKAAAARGPSRIDEVMDMEVDGQPLLTTTRDHAEGLAAFRERRPAVFDGT